MFTGQNALLLTPCYIKSVMVHNANMDVNTDTFANAVFVVVLLLT